MNKKGQVSIFIILGVVLVLLTVVFISSNKNIQTQPLYEVTEKVDEQFAAVQKYVVNCLDTTAREGLDKLGSQGGYIDPVAAGLSVNYPSSKQPAQAFKFTQGSNLIVPYWNYLASEMDCSGDCLLVTKAPDLDGSDSLSIQSQLQQYVNSQLATCLADFAPLVNSGYNVTTLEPITTAVLIRENDVRFFVTYPLDVVRGTTSQKITQYAVDEAVPLRPLYNYAALITQAQKQYSFLERHTLSLISFNSGPSTKLLPPTSATTYDYVSTVFWMRSYVKQMLQQLFLTYTPGLQVANARNFERKVYEQDSVSPSARLAIQRVYDNMILPLNSSSQVDTYHVNNRFDVNFDYLNWPIYFDVNSEGEIIKPHSLVVSDFMFGMQQFDTYYDISYPVMVTLSDSNAFNKRGYHFSFGLQANIRGSAPLDENYTLLEGVTPSAGTLVCNADQYNTGFSKITVVDNKTAQPVSDVSISFSCGRETCTVGSTDDSGSWSGKLPICGGAMLTLAKDESYAQRAIQLSTNLDESVDVGTVSLEPYRILNASVERKLLKKGLDGKWQLSNIATPLTSSEFAVVSYTQVDPKIGADPVQGAFIYYGGIGYNSDTQVKIVPGTYQIAIQVLSDTPLVIPTETKTAGKWPMKVKYTVPEIKMEQFPSGSLTLNDSYGYWYVSASDLEQPGVDAVTFTAIGPQRADLKHSEDLQIINEISNYIAPNYNVLKPVFEPTSSLYLPAAPTQAQFVTITPTFFNSLEPGNDANFSISVIGSQQIKTVEVTAPVSIPATNFPGSSISVPIPDSAYGKTTVTFVFTFTDGTTVTKSTTVDVKGASELSKLTAQIVGKPVATTYQFSNATIHDGQLQVKATFADGSQHDVTSGLYGTRYSSTDGEVVDLLDGDGHFGIFKAGESNITVDFEDKSVEIPITITK